jgi:hypothetical protein
MKIRTGFISNSSTSCFICGRWGKLEHSIDEIVEILKKMLDFYNDLEGTEYSFDSVFEMPKMADRGDIEKLGHWDVDKSEVEGNILIYGTSDNSIPYMLFEMIMQKFHAERVHLG